MLALWWAYSIPDQRVLVISAGESGRRRLPAEAAAMAQRSPLLSPTLLTAADGERFLRALPFAFSEIYMRGEYIASYGSTPRRV